MCVCEHVCVWNEYVLRHEPVGPQKQRVSSFPLHVCIVDLLFLDLFINLYIHFWPQEVA